MPVAGWYPDPDGTPGRLRYWDGSTWTSSTRLVDDATGPVVGPSGRSTTTSPAGPGPASADSTRKRRRTPAVLIGLAALLVIVVVSAVAVFWPRGDDSQAQGGDPTSTASSYDDGPTDSPSASPSATASGRTSPTPSSDGATSSRPVACDLASPDQGSAQPADGRVHGGPLSFAQLGAPWTAPAATTRVPYSRDAQVQTYQLPEKLPWQASAQVGITTFSPFPGGTEATSEMLQCVLTSDFYTGVDVRVSENEVATTTISGDQATERDVLLRFSHPDLSTTGSRLRFVVVESDPVSYYFSAVPMERADLIAQLDGATRSLRVT